MKHAIPCIAVAILLLASCAPVQAVQTAATATQFAVTQTPGFTPRPGATATPFLATETPGIQPGPASTEPDTVTPQEVVPTVTEATTSTPSSERVREIDVIERFAADPDAYRADFAYLTSPQYLEDLRARDARGETPGFSNTVIYIEPYDASEFAAAEKTMVVMHYEQPSLRLQEQGFETIYHLTQGILYMNRDSRPFVLEDARLTEINGTSALFYTLKWENRDGSFGYESHFWIPRPGGALGEEAMFATGLKDDSLLVNGMFFVDPEHCVQTLSHWGADPQGVCDWYMDAEEEGKRREVYSSWQETGILTNLLSNGSAYLPISPGVLSETE